MPPSQTSVRTRSLWLAAALAVMLFSAGCETLGTGGGEAAARRAARAEELAAQGDHRGAASLYEQAARQASAAERDALLLSAAQSWYQAGLRDRALRAMDQRSTPMPADAPDIHRLLSAMLALEKRDPTGALALLAPLRRQLSASLAADVLETEARARFANDESASAVSALLERELWLSSAAAIQANTDLIWRELLLAAAAGAPLSAPAGIDPVTRGWLSLARIAHDHRREPLALKSRLLDWTRQHPDHPGAGHIVDGLLAAYRDMVRFPHQVALLLPLTGRIADAGIATRDGVLAAWLSHLDPSERPALRMYDTEALGAAGAYRAAILDGADFLVGPLNKTAVEEVAAVARSVPMLALNYLPDETRAPAGFWQFGLAPEDEAAQAATEALAQGLVSSLALIPSGIWGDRLFQSFRKALEGSGGRILDVAVYEPAMSDYSQEIRRMLRLDESEARHRRLVSTIGVPLEFQTRRRQDVDFIFVAALPPQARLIRPQLRFHYASDLPVYTTSAAYEPDPDANRDMEGMVFPDIPWMISAEGTAADMRSTLQTYFPGQFQRRGRLYALGYDAYRLIPPLYADRRPLSKPLEGLTGLLQADRDGRIRRTLPFAVMHNGEPVPLAPDIAPAPGPLADTGILHRDQ